METAIYIFAWIGLIGSMIVAGMLLIVAAIASANSIVDLYAKSEGIYRFTSLLIGMIGCPKGNPVWMAEQLMDRFKKFQAERPEAAGEFLRLVKCESTPANESE